MGRRCVRVINQSKGTLLGDDIKVADSSWTRLVGLIGRRSLSTGQGLLIFPSNGVHTFGMLFAIDVIFIDRDDRVISVRRQLRPFRLTSLNWKAKSVIELPANTIAATGTEPGDQLLIEPV